MRTTKDDLRSRLVERQNYDAYQWALTISTHEERHVLQIRDRAFELQYPPSQYGPGLFRGAYQHANRVIMFLFEFQGRSVGTHSTLEGDSLTVQYAHPSSIAKDDDRAAETDTSSPTPIRQRRKRSVAVVRSFFSCGRKIRCTRPRSAIASGKSGQG